MRLSGVLLRSGAPAASLAFYRERLGMAPRPDSGDRQGRRHVLGFPGPDRQDAALELWHEPETGRAGPALAPYRHGRDEVYWKIGITLPDLALARKALLAAGESVDEARQFRDIGYLCHLADPEGFQIELLQHRFEANHRPQEADPAHRLGSRPTLGQATLRVTDIEAALGFYRDRLGLRLLSVQPVAPHGFTLYFLADTRERPPRADLEAVENREWLWQRPYSTLELQHLWQRPAAAPALNLPRRDRPDFLGLRFETPAIGPLRTDLADLGHDSPYGDGHTIAVIDPQGLTVLISEPNKDP